MHEVMSNLDRPLFCRSLRELGPWERHKLIMQSHRAQGADGRETVPKTDATALRESHQFIREDGGQAHPEATWGERLAARYYNKLLKEYALCDLSRYRELKVGLRWRTEQEVVVGKGQFECGSLTCKARHELANYELPFQYKEGGQDKQVMLYSGSDELLGATIVEVAATSSAAMYMRLSVAASSCAWWRVWQLLVHL
jgi:hypothetical protein